MDKQAGLLKCLDIISLTLNAANTVDIETIWLEIQTLCNTDGLLIGVSESTNSVDILGSTAIWFGIAETWMSEYQTQNYVLKDPVVKLTLANTNKIITWQDAYTSADAAGREFAKQANLYGLNHGYAIGQARHKVTRTASVASITYNPKNLSEDQHFYIKQILPHLNEVLTRPGFLRFPDLTSQESVVLQWASIGKSNWEIGTIMGITERTVRFHCNNIYKKLNVNNKANAVTKARLVGII